MSVVRLLTPQEAIMAADRGGLDDVTADALVALIERGEVQGGIDEDGEACFALTPAGLAAHRAETGGLS